MPDDGNLIEPNRKPLQDQIIGHDLQGLGPDRVVPLLIIELRRLREELARYNAELVALLKEKHDGTL